MQVFYISRIEPGLNVLNPEESHHCARVLKMHKGEKAGFLDGKGTFATGNIAEPHQKHSMVEILEIHKDHRKRPYSLHIAIAPTRNIDRFEWFIEKCVEIGIDEISPLLCERSERRILKNQRLNKRILSAMKQSMNALWPKLNELMTFDDFVTGITGTNNFIAHLDESNPSLLKDQELYHTSTLIMVGPEGDFSPRELKLAKEKNITAVSLGPNRLRTETAGIVCCHTVSIVNL